MKFFRNKITIPVLSEMATDPEINAAWENLCALQKRLRERKKGIALSSKILYDQYESLKKKAFSPKKDIESCSEAAGEEKSRSLMKSLSQEKEKLVSNQTLLTEVDRWPSR